ncbi:non-homologous end-joining DNA ligase [Nocardioides dubius]|uniref:DNA ligase D polymerase domain-containing protein n=1 Tax=Nocardioides dubius TaxID=317019 RepID=A0ABN1TMV1_9ACTN
MTEIRAELEGRTLKITNLDKVLYPVTGTTKAEVLDYYLRIAPVLLPHLEGRAVTRIRWPHGVGGESFFEKNRPAGAPSWLHTVSVPTTGSRTAEGKAGELRFPIVDGAPALAYLVNLASLELHVHQWWVDEDGEVQPPDRLVIDLDPGPDVGLMQCAEVALLVRGALAERDLTSWPVTSGSKGLHLYAPLDGSLDSDDASDLAREVAEQLQSAHPKLLTATMTKARRHGKVFLDWSQNAGSKTTVSPYSLRGTERPQVATPRTWAEIEAGADDEFGLEQCTFTEVLARVEEHGDLFLS